MMRVSSQDFGGFHRGVIRRLNLYRYTLKKFERGDDAELYALKLLSRIRRRFAVTNIYVSCPNCGQPLTVEEFEKNYAIKNGAQVVNACPACAVDLEYGPNGLAIPGVVLPE